MNDPPNQHLIGKEGGRLELSTPALVIDMPTFRANIRSGQEIISNNGVGTRPHIKAHRSVHIAKLQVDAGARGISSTTLGEAEALFAGGIKKILLTSPVVEPAEIERLAEMNKDLEDLMVVVVDLENLKALQLAARIVSKKFRVLIDVDIAHNRSAVTSVDACLELARYIAEAAFEKVVVAAVSADAVICIATVEQGVIAAITGQGVDTAATTEAHVVAIITRQAIGGGGLAEEAAVGTGSAVEKIRPAAADDRGVHNLRRRRSCRHLPLGQLGHYRHRRRPYRHRRHRRGCRPAAPEEHVSARLAAHDIAVATAGQQGIVTLAAFDRVVALTAE